MATSLTRKTVVGTFVQADGVTPAKGGVSVKLTAPLLDSAGNVIVEPSEQYKPMDATGAVQFSLVATNDPTVSPDGVAYRFVVRINGESKARTFDVEIDHAAPDTINLADLVPASVTPRYTYALASALTSHAALTTNVHGIPNVTYLKRVSRVSVAAADSLGKHYQMADFKCDGLDDNQTIDDALAEMAARGGMVELSYDTFAQSGTIHVPAKTTLLGQGMGVTILDAPALLPSDDPAAGHTTSDQIRLVGAQHAHVHDLTVRSAFVKNAGVSVDHNSQDCLIERVEAIGHNYFGALAKVGCKRITYRACRFIDGGGFLVDQFAASGISEAMEDITVEHCLFMGVLANVDMIAQGVLAVWAMGQPVRRLAFRNNQILTAAQSRLGAVTLHALAGASIDDVWIEVNELLGNPNPGVYILANGGSLSHLSIAGNHIQGNTGNAVKVVVQGGSPVPTYLSLLGNSVTDNTLEPFDFGGNWHSSWVVQQNIGDDLQRAGSPFTVMPLSPTVTPLAVRGAANQAANLTEWQDSAGAPKFAITQDAQLRWAIDRTQTTNVLAGSGDALPGAPATYLQVGTDDGLTYLVPAFVQNQIPQANLVAAYSFADGSGQTITDLSGNGRDLTLGATSDAEGSDPLWVPEGISTDGIGQFVGLQSLMGAINQASGPWTLLLCLIDPTGVTGKPAIGTFTGDRPLRVDTSGGSWRVMLGNTNAFVPRRGVGQADWLLVRCQAGQVSSVWVNGTQRWTGTPSAGSVGTNIRLGSSAFGYGSFTFVHLALWSRLLSDAEAGRAYAVSKSLAASRSLALP